MRFLLFGPRTGEVLTTLEVNVTRTLVWSQQPFGGYRAKRPGRYSLDRATIARRASAQSRRRSPSASRRPRSADLPTHDGDEQLVFSSDRDLARQPADVAAIAPAAAAVLADAHLAVAVDGCRARRTRATSAARRTSCRADATSRRRRWRRRSPARWRPPSAAGRPGRRRRRSAARAASCVSHERPPSRLTWMSGDSALTATIEVARHLELVVVALAEAGDRLPRLAVIARADQPEVLGQAAAALRVPGREQVAGPGEAHDEVAGDRRLALRRGELPGELLGFVRAGREPVQRRAAADHQRAVAGIDRDRVDRRARRRSPSRRPASGAGAVVAASVGALVGAGASVGLLAAARRERERDQQREPAHAAQSNLARAGGHLDRPAQVREEARLGEGRPCMTHRRVHRAAAIVAVAPRQRTRLVERGQHVDAPARVGAELVPLVGCAARPPAGRGSRRCRGPRCGRCARRRPGRGA